MKKNMIMLVFSLTNGLIGWYSTYLVASLMLSENHPEPYDLKFGFTIFIVSLLVHLVWLSVGGKAWIANMAVDFEWWLMPKIKRILKRKSHGRH